MAGYHRGELAVQARAGLRESAARRQNAIRPAIPAVAAQFLAAQPMIVIGAQDENGRMWASLLTGEPGFMRASDERTVHIGASPVTGDPLVGVLRTVPRVGSIAIELERRRRMRVNGTAHPTRDGLCIEVDQVFANCPKYIQQRAMASAVAGPAGPARTGTVLTARQRALIAGTDTFFVATADEQGNADASHRGGGPGFVRVCSPTRLRWPDYEGNAMFMTLGNLAANPAVGLLIVDWRSGTTLQVSGSGRVMWGPGAGRAVEVDVHAVVEIPHASPLRWSEPVFSRFNPPVIDAATEPRDPYRHPVPPTTRHPNRLS